MKFYELLLCTSLFLISFFYGNSDLGAKTSFDNLNAGNESLYFANTFTHNEPRLVFNSTNYPWRLFGKIIESTTTKTGCTAQLIGEKLILTNRHCISDSNGVILLKQHQFYYNIVNNNIYNASSVGAYPILWGGKRSSEDWAILELESPIGKELGYFGMKITDDFYSGNVGQKYNEYVLWEMNLCSNTSDPLEFLNKYSESQNSLDWLMDYSNAQLPKLCLGGYPSDLGNFNFTISRQCSILGHERGYWVHDCPTTRGSSGGAIFYKALGQYYIAALHKGGGRPEENSLLNVPFGGYSSNTAVKTDFFFKHASYLKSRHKNQAYFNFKQINTFGRYYYNFSDFNDSGLDTNNFLDCGKEAYKSLLNEKIISKEGTLNSDIANLVASKKIFEHPSKKNVFVGGYLVFYQLNNSSLMIGLVSPFDYTDYEGLSLVSKSNGENECSIMESDIIDKINSI